MLHNGRRYGSVALCRGGAPCPAPNAVKVGVFLHSRYDAELCAYLFIIALAKTVTPGGSPPAVPGAACATSHKMVLFSQKILAAQKAMTYADLLASGFILIRFRLTQLSILIHLNFEVSVKFPEHFSCISHWLHIH